MAYLLENSDFEVLLTTLHAQGYTVIGPVRRDHTIVYDEVQAVSDLPAGWTDAQAPGSYRLSDRDDGMLFGYSVGPQSWKRYLYPASVRLWQAQRQNGTFTVVEETPKPSKLAFLGMRPCDLQAVAIHDRIFLESEFADPTYRAQREQALFIVVNCTRAGGTCFCASMDTGPRAKAGFDLALTEVVTEDRHYFIVETDSRRGKRLLDALPVRQAEAEEVAIAEERLAETAASMGRNLDTENLKERLESNIEHAHWEDIARRCLTCGNCTMVCPTCFCTTVEDYTDLSGQQAERWRKWDSCFTMEFSYIHGGSVRYSPKARYRQWLMHKLATWVDQFGTFGCVGCGRCITWCPVGIDLTEEARLLTEKEKAR
jgi:sulfhydrogenase subunit beta (sulfur reductase)